MCYSPVLIETAVLPPEPEPHEKGRIVAQPAVQDLPGVQVVLLEQAAIQRSSRRNNQFLQPRQMAKMGMRLSSAAAISAILRRSRPIGVRLIAVSP